VTNAVTLNANQNKMQNADRRREPRPKKADREQHPHNRTTKGAKTPTQITREHWAGMQLQPNRKNKKDGVTSNRMGEKKDLPIVRRSDSNRSAPRVAFGSCQRLRFSGLIGRSFERMRFRTRGGRRWCCGEVVMATSASVRPT